MINEEANKSWAIRTYTDELLNFIIFTGCMYNLIDDENYVEERNALHDKLIQHMNDTRDLYRGYQWRMRPWRKDFVPNWENEGYTRQRENEEYEPRQLDYDTGLPMKEAVRKKC